MNAFDCFYFKNSERTIGNVGESRSRSKNKRTTVNISHAIYKGVLDGHFDVMSLFSVQLPW